MTLHRRASRTVAFVLVISGLLAAPALATERLSVTATGPIRVVVRDTSGNVATKDTPNGIAGGVLSGSGVGPWVFSDSDYNTGRFNDSATYGAPGLGFYACYPTEAGDQGAVNFSFRNSDPGSDPALDPPSEGSGGLMYDFAYVGFFDGAIGLTNDEVLALCGGAIPAFHKPLANADVIALSKANKPTPVRVLSNDVDPDGHKLKVLRFVRGVRCGTLTLVRGVASFRAPKGGCANRQRGIYVATNGKIASNRASIFVNPTRHLHGKKKDPCKAADVDSGTHTFNPYILAEGGGWVPFHEVLTAHARDRCGHGNVTGKILVGTTSIRTRPGAVVGASAWYRTSLHRAWQPVYVRTAPEVQPIVPVGDPASISFTIGNPQTHVDLAASERITDVKVETIVVYDKAIGAPTSHLQCSFLSGRCKE